MDKDILEKYIGKFDAYLDGHLSKTELVDIQKEIKENAELKKALKNHVHSRAQIRKAGELDLKTKLKQRFDNKSSISNEIQKPTKTNRIWPYLLLALLLAGLSWFFFQSKDTQEAQVQFASLAELEVPSFDVMRSNSESVKIENWESTLEDFLKGDYKASLRNAEEIELNEAFINKHGGKFYLLKGVANLKLKSHVKATEAFNEISATNPYYDQAQWYQALNHFYADDITKAKVALNKILNTPKHFKSEEAKVYLQKIE